MIAFIFSGIIKAYDITSDTQIYVPGNTIGIELETGILVTKTFGVNTSNGISKPWEEADIKEGDYITKMNGITLSNVKMLIRILEESLGNPLNVEIKRNETILEKTVKPVLNSEKKYSLGLYIKDHLLGVGTLTFIIPSINIYGSVGHSITDLSTYGGTIYEATVNSIVKSRAGSAGMKNATLIDGAIGNISKTSDIGVYGTITSNSSELNVNLMNFKVKEDVNLGKASILTCIDGTNVKEYSIEITKLVKQTKKSIKGIKFKVTDSELISSCGGIVQGMSGSPIIQDDKIVGAVTHVLLDNPKEGYGIYIEFMFEEMGIYIID